MSPWYTGYHKGASLYDGTHLKFYPDDPDIVASFAFRIYRKQAIVSLRDQRERTWMAEWSVPLSESKERRAVVSEQAGEQNKIAMVVVAQRHDAEHDHAGAIAS